METRLLITKVLLPRIKQLEEEVATLRRHTWPYVQSQREAHQLDDMAPIFASTLNSLFILSTIISK